MTTLALDTDIANETMLDAALELARAGFAVFPIWPVDPEHKKGTGKHPRCWHGHNDATTDETQIERWWSEPESGAADAWQCSPANNIGIAVPDGMVIVDMDPRNGGENTLGAMCDANGWDLASTLTVDTGGGGKQFYLSCEPGRRFPKNLDAHFGPGIDLKQHGGFVVAPPSKHKSGGVYSWDQSTGDIEPAPAWLTLLSKVTTATEVTPAPDVPDGAELDDATRARLDLAIEAIEPFYVDGEKHYLAGAIGGYLRNARLPALAAKYVVSQLPSDNPSARVAHALWAFGPEVNRPSGAKSLRDLGRDDLLAKLDALGFNSWSRPINGPRARAREAKAAARTAAPKDPGGEEFHTPSNESDFAGPYILQSATHAETILLWHGPDYGHQPVAVGSLRLVIKTLGIDNDVPLFEDVELKNGETKTVKLPAQVIIERHARPFSQTIYDFAKQVSEYEPDRDRVVVGYPQVNVVGVFDCDVDAWLKVLAGDAYSRLEAWIASCAQGHIERLAAALVLTGPADLGKSLLSCAAAGLWGALTPPRAELLIKQFNGELKNCPVVCDEEAQLFGSKQLSTKRFRDLTQSTERSIELKGLETFTLRGALRLIVPCNEISDLRFTDLGGPDILNAVSDRLCVIDAKPRADECKETLARLRVPGGWVCDRERVTAHMAWICETVTLPTERFIGSGGADSTAAVLAGHVEENTELWDTFREWVDGDRVNLWSAHGGRLCADPKQLATTLVHSGKGWDALRVKRALEPFKTRDYRPDGDERPRLWELAADRVTAALQLEAETRGKLEAKLEAIAAQGPGPQLRPVGRRRFGRYDG